MKCCLTTKTLICVTVLIAHLIVAGRAYALSVIVAPNESAITFAKEISSALNDKSIIVESPEDPQLKHASLIITIGDNAYRSIPGTIKAPIIASFISYNSFYSSSQEKRSNTYAIYMEPDPKVLMSEIIHVFGEGTKIGYIFDDEDYYYQRLIESNRNQIVGIPLFDNALKSLSNLYTSQKVDGFYISDNRSIFNRSNILLVLESLYRNRVPAITTNKSLDGRGSVLTLYVSYEEIIKRTTEIADALFSGKPVTVNNFGDPRKSLDQRLAQKVNLSVGRIK